jgi:hypothetical protein
MKRLRSRPLIASLPAIAILSLAGCANTNRVATLNLETSGATVANTLEKQLAIKGFPSAKVTCAKTLVVDVGTTDTCRLSGAGSNGTVHFTFKNYGGTIVLSSVKTS